MDVERDYQTVMGSDVARGGMFLELWERAPRKLALWALYSDVDGSIEYEQHVADVPAEVRQWFEQEAARRLPPIRD
jgi:hypothetical protein